MRKLVFAGLIILYASTLLGCSVKVRHEYDKKNDFSRYRTYTWIDDKGVNRSLKAAGLIESAIKKELAAKGYGASSMDEAEFGVLYYGGVKGRVDVVDYNFSAWGEDYGDPGSGSPVDREGTLVIEIVDLKKRIMVWRGWAGVFIKDSSAAEAVVNEVVAKILEKFPPQ